MATRSLAPILHYLRTVTGPETADNISDAELLSRFARHRDEAAFTSLVRRHGALVFAVCRRVLRDGHTAEDAFQATFLILARKAASLRRPELLAPWLHGVAYRTALKARTETQRRRVHEQQAAVAAEIATDDELIWRDLRAVLDEEVNRLPNRYRAPVVLCYVQGRTNAEAARQLGCSRGTVATLLARARDRLRRRLTHRGVGLSLGVALTGLTEAARGAAVPRMLEQVTVKAAALLAAGQTQAAGALASQAVALAKGVSKGMLLEKLRILAALVLMTAVLGIGAGVGAYRAGAQESAVDKSETTSPPQPAAEPAQPRQKAPAPPPSNALARPSFTGKLPFGPAPVQMLAVLSKDGRLTVCRKIAYYQPATTEYHSKKDGIRRITSYKQMQYDLVSIYEVDAVDVFDIKGDKVEKKEVRKRLRKETLILVSADGRPVDPLQLRLYKEDTLVFVLPTMGRVVEGGAVPEYPPPVSGPPVGVPVAPGYPPPTVAPNSPIPVAPVATPPAGGGPPVVAPTTPEAVPPPGP